MPSVHDRILAPAHLLELNLPDSQLYLYSKSDQMCSSTAVETFRDIQMNKKQKKNVDFIDFNNSEHVQHGQKHPLVYEVAVQRFAHNIIEREKEKQRMKNKSSLSNENNVINL